MLATACTVMEGTAIPRPEGDARLTVTVAPVLPAGNVSTNYVPSTFFQNAGALSGLPGLFIGVGLDVVVSSVRYSQHAWLRESLAASFEDVDFEQHFIGILDPLPTVSFANLQLAEPTEGGRAYFKIAGDVIRRSPVDAVVVLDPAYRMSPDRDYLAVTILQYSYRRRVKFRRSRDKPTVRHSIRRYTYLSPRHPLEPRPLSDEERAAMEADIRARYEFETDDPRDREALAKARDEALEYLEGLEKAPRELLFAETWTADRVQTYLAQASANLRVMLQMDWDDADAPIGTSGSETITVLRGEGPEKRIKAVPIGETSTHVIMRSQQYDNLYAVPKQ